VERVSSPGSLAALQPEWRALSAAHGGGIPFSTWDWYVTWWDSFAASNLLVSDSPRLLAFRNGSGRLVGVAPLMLTRRPGRGPAATRVLDYIGADPNLTEIRGPLVDRAWEAAFYEALSRYASETADGWDWVAWRGLRLGGPGERHVASLPGATVGEPLCAYTVALPSSWEEFKTGRSRNLKEALRKCKNSLLRDGLVARLEVAAAPAEVERALERFLDLHRMRAEAPNGPAHPNVFASPSSRRFLAHVVGRFAARGEARVFLLHIGGVAVAARIAFALGDTLYL
jgi:CelD/BcsL family acetyltransferase involved in cellulose biosynthesis